MSDKSDIESFLSKPVLLRLARRAGCKRINGEVYNMVRDEAEKEILRILEQSMMNCESHKRKIVKSKDVIDAIESERNIRFAFGDETQKRVKLNKVV